MQEPNKKHKCEWGQCGKCNPNIHGSAGGVAPKEEVSGEDWSEEFDKIAPKIDWRGYPSRETIKAFIKQTIEKERERVERLKKVKPPLTAENLEPRMLISCYNEAIDDVLNILKEEK